MVICYHTVGAAELDAFCRQMDELLRIARPVRVDARRGLGERGPCVAVTFDDAYASVVERAVPELVARRIPCAVFVPTGYLGQPPGWYVAPGSPERLERVVRAEQLRSLPVGLVAVGSHTVTHCDVSRQDEKTLQRELKESRSQLERIMGRRIRLLALPYGHVNRAALIQARRAGYARVLYGKPRLTRMRAQDFLVGRVRVDPADCLCEFRLKVLGAYCWLPALSRAKRALYALGYLWPHGRKRKPSVDPANAS
jgi:peptidoglycan/xylan/chitin deacetylase (PgdA/CDA1 family)